MTVQQTFDLALQHHQAGRLAEAEALYEKILAVQPGHAEALHLYGVACHQLGRHEVAAERIRQALVLEPGHVTAHANLGEVYRAMGQLDEAIASMRRAIQVAPDDAPAHYNLGNALRDQGQLDEAIAEFRWSLRLQPDYAEAHNNLGNVLRTRGQMVEAIAEFRSALEVRSDYVEALNNLGTALRNCGRFDEAVAAYRRAIDLRADYAEAYNNLGITHAEAGRLDEAISAYRRALELKPIFSMAHNNLGNVLKDHGELQEAIASFRAAIASNPQDPAPCSNLICSLHFLPNQDATAIAEEQRRWSRQFGQPAQRLAHHVNQRDPERRLRIGYLSPDFRAHVIARNLMPLWQFRDPEHFEVVCYSDVQIPDPMTETIRQHADHWRSTTGLADGKLAELIRQDDIDVLVDLTQHLAGNRLTVFARQPAPVQVSFAGYPESTGVEAIGYRISDRWMEAGKGEEEWQMADGKGESVFLLDSFWCYDPCGTKVEMNELPAMESGQVTFGSLNNFCKVNEPLLRLWARVLGKLDDSRLILLSYPGSHRQRALDFLAREGVDAQRVEFVAPRPRREYLELYHRLDLMLDTFPYNGHTTSLDALWMGVPVVSLCGERPVSRAGLSQLSNLGLPELVAYSEDDYVRIATDLAHDSPRLGELRRTLRPRMEASVLMDAPRFASSIEAAYRAMWRQWCAGKTSE